MCKFEHDSEELLLSFAINMIIIATIIIQIGENGKKFASLDGGVLFISFCIAITEVSLCVSLTFYCLIPGERRTGEAHPAPAHFLSYLLCSFCSGLWW